MICPITDNILFNVTSLHLLIFDMFSLVIFHFISLEMVFLFSCVSVIVFIMIL